MIISKGTDDAEFDVVSHHGGAFDGDLKFSTNRYQYSQ